VLLDQVITLHMHGGCTVVSIYLVWLLSIGFFNFLIWATSPQFVSSVCGGGDGLPRDDSRLRALPTGYTRGAAPGGTNDGAARSSLQAVHGSDGVGDGLSDSVYHDMGGSRHLQHSDSAQYSRPNKPQNERLLPYALSSDRLNDDI
jgi:hypothetical protein